MNTADQLIEGSAATVLAAPSMARSKSGFLEGGARGTRLVLIMTMMFVVGGSTGCQIYTFCNGTGRTLEFDLEGFRLDVDPGSCRVIIALGEDPGFEIRTLDGYKIYERVELRSPSYTYDGFDANGGPLGFPPDVTDATPLILLCNESSEDIRIIPRSRGRVLSEGMNFDTDGWKVNANETEEFITIATGQKSFDVGQTNANCSIDVSYGDQVIWDGQDLICKEAVLVKLENTSAADVEIVWLEGKGRLIRTTLGSGESRTIGVPIGEVASFEAEIGGAVVDSCTLSDPMAGHQIVWDGTELTGCDPPDPPDPTHMATIDLHNIGTSAGPVIFVEAGKDPLTEGVRVIKFVPNSLDFPTGAPVSIQVWSGEGVTLHGECTINDPTDGDSVTWDGVVVTCEDL